MKVYYLFFFLLLHLPLEIISQSTPDQHNLESQLNELFDYCYQHEIFNGSVIIYKNGKEVYNKSFGTFGNSNKPLTADSPFLLASLSKSITAMGIQLLADKKAIALDDPVHNYLKQFPYAEITIRHLLNQTSGIVEYQGFLNKNMVDIKAQFEESGKQIKNQDILNLLIKRQPPLQFKPGQDFNYSNTNYVLLASIIEHVSGQDFKSYIEQHIFQKLEMHHSFVMDSSTYLNQNRVFGYRIKMESNRKIANDLYPFLNIYGDGGIFSSANDLQKWIRALSANELVSESMQSESLKKPPFLKEKMGPYGFGWFLKTIPFNGNFATTHSGEFVGFSNAIFRDLDEDHSIIILSNNSSTYRATLNSILVRILYNVPYELPKLHSGDWLAKHIFKKGINQALKSYHNERALPASNLDFQERHLNRLGYDLLELNKIEEAIKIFKLNVHYYPNSANVYDSLGEAYLMNKNPKEALKNYEQSLILDPNNQNAIKILKKLKQ